MLELKVAGMTCGHCVKAVTEAVQSVAPQAVVAVDRQGRRGLLFGSEWDLQYFGRQHPDLSLLDESPVAAPTTKRTAPIA